MKTVPLLLEKLVGEKLQAIWAHNDHQAFCHRDFMAPYELKPGALLFVGINPSFTEADRHIRYYDAHKGNHSYFRPMKEIAQAVEQPWMHLDLLYYRETKQATLYDLVKQPGGKQFIWQQIQLFPELLASAQPSAIIVANAGARMLLGADKNRQTGDNTWLGLDFKWDDELGTHRHNNIPVFFTSMLSGQRALDRGSRERLIWHTKRALTSRN